MTGAAETSENGRALEPHARRDLAAVAWLGVLCAFLASPPILFGAALMVRYRSVDPLLLWAVAMSLLWLCFLHAAVRRPFWLHLALAPLYVATAADLFLMQRLGSRLTSSYLSIIFTQYRDAGDFVRAFRTDLAAMVPLVAALYALGLRGIRRVELRAPRSVKWVAAALLLVGYLGPLARQARQMPVATAILDIAAHDMSSPFGSVVQAAVTVAHLYQTERFLNERRAFSFGATRAGGAAEEEIYVLVIGESARPDRWSLNGYGRETNPLLSRVRNVVVLRDYVASAAHTAVAVPAMMSLAPVTRWREVQSQRSIVSAFREVGFDTRWLSTQEVDAWGGIVNQLAAEAVTRRYFPRSLDDVLVDELARILADPARGQRLFVVLHTRGNHFGTTKYPREFRRYPDSGGTWKQDVDNAYDNGILYTDSILARTIELVRATRTRSAVFYASDHGENLADVDGVYGHGYGNEWDLRAAALFWCSDLLREAQPRKIQAAIAHASARTGHENLAHSILDLAGIEVPARVPWKSFFSEGFRESPRYFMARGVIRQFDDVPRPAAASAGVE